MSYDTDHVRNAGGIPRPITDFHAFMELIDNADLATIYTAIRSASTATGPELVETAAVSKKTVYEYLRKLEQASLITKVDDDGAAVYAAEDFELTLTVRDVEVSVTPELITVIAHRNEYPVINRVLDEDGLVTFALAHDLVKAHSDGEVTIRQIADLTGLSSGTTYDLVEAIYAINDLGDEDLTPTTYTPADFDDGSDDISEESAEK